MGLYTAYSLNSLSLHGEIHGGIKCPFKTSLYLLIDTQESFRYKPYWSEQDLRPFVTNLQRLIDGSIAQDIPVIQIFHIEDTGAFSLASGHIEAFPEIAITPAATFYKRSHSALIGSGLNVWLVQHGIRRIIVSGIRTEQCCETTARHASDSGYMVDFVTEATLTLRHEPTWPSMERGRDPGTNRAGACGSFRAHRHGRPGPCEADHRGRRLMGTGEGASPASFRGVATTRDAAGRCRSAGSAASREP